MPFRTVYCRSTTRLMKKFLKLREIRVWGFGNVKSMTSKAFMDAPAFALLGSTVILSTVDSSVFRALVSLLHRSRYSS